MGDREIIYSNKAPVGRGPFPQAVKVNGFLFVSGQGPLDPKTNTPINGNFEEQVHQTLRNIREIVLAAGMELKDAVRVTIYLTDLQNIPRFNEIYEQYFPGEKPARTLVQVGLRGIEVEMESTFYAS